LTRMDSTCVRFNSLCTDSEKGRIAHLSALH